MQAFHYTSSIYIIIASLINVLGNSHLDFIKTTLQFIWLFYSSQRQRTGACGHYDDHAPQHKEPLPYWDSIQDRINTLCDSDFMHSSFLWTRVYGLRQINYYSVGITTLIINSQHCKRVSTYKHTCKMSDSTVRYLLAVSPRSIICRH